MLGCERADREGAPQQASVPGRSSARGPGYGAMPSGSRCRVVGRARPVRRRRNRATCFAGHARSRRHSNAGDRSRTVPQASVERPGTCTHACRSTAGAKHWGQAGRPRGRYRGHSRRHWAATRFEEDRTEPSEDFSSCCASRAGTAWPSSGAEGVVRGASRLKLSIPIVRRGRPRRRPRVRPAGRDAPAPVDQRLRDLQHPIR